MSQHPSLRSSGKDKKHRSVLKRYERLKILKDKEKWKAGESIYGLSKVKIVKFKIKKEKAAPAEGAAGEAAATPAAAGAAASAAPQQKGAPQAKAAPQSKASGAKEGAKQGGEGKKDAK